MNIPEKLLYTKEHEWVKKEDGQVTIGITDFAQSELGDIVYVEVDTINETLEAEEVFGTVEAVKTVSDLFMPIDGKIIEVNEDLNDEPESVNTNPYDKGWMVKIELSESYDSDSLLDSKSYIELIG